MNGSSWATQFQAPHSVHWGASQNGMPLIPKQGGYGQTPQLPYMRTAQPEVKPAGYGAVELGTEGMNLPHFLAKPPLSGRNIWGNPWRQGLSNRVRAEGFQGLNGTVIFVG